MNGFPWRATLFISLAFNLLVIGAAAGAFGAGVRLERDNPRAVVERMPGPRAFMAALPPATRVKVRAELVRSWDQSRQLRQQAQQARRDAFAAAAAEPFDAARVRAAFTRLRAADQATIAVFHDNVVAAFANMTPQERAQALDALRTATPATRRAGIAPEAPQAAGAVTPEQRIERRPLLRDAIRERRMQRRQQMLQQQEQPAQNPP
jgi:uncharacterized membrane protein